MSKQHRWWGVRVDLDAYVAARRPSWQRLAQLSGQRKLDATQADELVWLYQSSATDLSVVRTQRGDQALVGYLSRLVARGRAAVTASHTNAAREVAQFLGAGFPAMLYRTWRWWACTAVVSMALAVGLAVWVARDPTVQAQLAAPEQIQQLVNHDFANYYTEYPSQSFALKVWINNAWVAAQCLVMGVLILPVFYVLWGNMANVGVAAGFMAANDKLPVFFGLIVPHGLLELTAVFVAAGAGLRLGWSWIAPGARSRARALAQEGRATIAMAMGLMVVLLISGLIEGFVTGSALPTAARISIGVAAQVAFLAYVFIVGRRAAARGERGDLLEGAGDTLTEAG